MIFSYCTHLVLKHGLWNNVVFSNIGFPVDSYSITTVSPANSKFLIFGWSCDPNSDMQLPSRVEPGSYFWKAAGLLSRGNNWSIIYFWFNSAQTEANNSIGNSNIDDFYTAGSTITMTIDRDAQTATWSVGSTSWGQTFAYLGIDNCDNYYPSISFTGAIGNGVRE